MKPPRQEVEFRIAESLNGEIGKRTRDIARAQVAATLALADAIREQTEMADRIDQRQYRRRREGRA